MSERPKKAYWVERITRGVTTALVYADSVGDAKHRYVKGEFTDDSTESTGAGFGQVRRAPERDRVMRFATHPAWHPVHEAHLDRVGVIVGLPDGRVWTGVVTFITDDRFSIATSGPRSVPVTFFFEDNPDITR